MVRQTLISQTAILGAMQLRTQQVNNEGFPENNMPGRAESLCNGVFTKICQHDHF